MKGTTESLKAIEAVVGLDAGDRHGQVAVVSMDGELLDEGRVQLTPEALRVRFGGMGRSRVAMEAGTQSAWVSTLLRSLGHEVLVLEVRQLKAISDSVTKSDRTDARTLAHLARLGEGFLHTVTHRSLEEQADLAVIRSRDGLVRARTLLINLARGMVKGCAVRVKKCDAEQFTRHARPVIPEELRPALDPVLEAIDGLSRSIKEEDERIARLCEEKYPETGRLLQVKGVGPVTSLAYILTLGEVGKRQRSRSVGAYLGMVAKRRQSGDDDPELRITRRGDALLRRLLVGCAHYILERGPDTTLKRWGLEHAQRGGKTAKKKAVVGVARKLAVLLHVLWRTGESYEPLRGCPGAALVAA